MLQSYLETFIYLNIEVTVMVELTFHQRTKIAFMNRLRSHLQDKPYYSKSTIVIGEGLVNKADECDPMEENFDKTLKDNLEDSLNQEQPYIKEVVEAVNGAIVKKEAERSFLKSKVESFAMEDNLECSAAVDSLYFLGNIDLDFLISL